MHRIRLFVALLLLSSSSNGLSNVPFDLIESHAPRLRFDSKFGQDSGLDSKCFPSSAHDYFEQRKTGTKPVNLCNQDYNTIQRGEVPAYYMAKECSPNVYVIRYWYFYAWQSACATFIKKFGHHPADWESFVVKIEDGQLSRAAYVQHGDWYTKKFGGFETAEGLHPIVYAGKNSHGSYHSAGGIGGCLYWDDFRKPGEKDMHFDTWRQLIEIKRGQDAPPWMNCRGNQCFDGIGHPIEQTGDLCNMNGCRDQGCQRSDLKESEQF